MKNNDPKTEKCLDKAQRAAQLRGNWIPHEIKSCKACIAKRSCQEYKFFQINGRFFHNQSKQRLNSFGFKNIVVKYKTKTVKVPVRFSQKAIVMTPREQNTGKEQNI